MGLAIRIDDEGRYLPVLTCDTCNEAIEDWHMAVVAHDLRANEGITSVRTYHKGDCDQGAVGQPARLTDDSGWMQLDHYLPWLLWNHDWGKKSGAGTDKRYANLTIEVPEPFEL